MHFYFCLFLVDISAYHRGYHGDANETFFVGNVSDSAKKLVKTTYECLMLAINEGNACDFKSGRVKVLFLQNKLY